MYLLALLTVVGVAFAEPSTELFNTLTEEQRAAAYVLPRGTTPTSYDVRLFLDPDNEDYFTGAVDVKILPSVSTKEIVLHAMQMQISANDIEVYSDINPAINLYQSHTLATDDTQIFRITLIQDMVVLQPHTIRIKNYRGQYAENMFGIYVSTYKIDGTPHKLITSQLQATYARRVFPCYDEPSFKAIFRTTIYSPPAYRVVRSNMPIREDSLKPEVTGYTKHEFQDTLPMSTYLLAYLVSNLDHIDNSMEIPYKDIYRVPFSIYSRPETQSTAMFALEFGQKVMVELEKYTEFEYSLPKMDNAAVPDFAGSAMENWGLVIYSERFLLAPDGVTTPATKQYLGSVISHESAHQWFGNEVGPLSWTYTWLNEGFATFFESFATDLVEPDWHMMDQFVLVLQKMFQSDAVLSVNSMTYAVYTPAEILATFNDVAYQKSGCVIRMMQNFLTPEVFRKGLVIYIKNNSLKSASPPKLYAALQQALNESDHSIPYALETVMQGWVNQGGFPVLTVTRSAATGQTIVIEQVRYLTNQTLHSNDRWYVPINWVLSSSPDFSDTSPQDWVPPTVPARSIDIPGLSTADWYIINKQQTGYYRVNYDSRNWIALANVLNTSHEVINELNRANLIDDACNLAKTGRLDYKYAFDLSSYLDKEKDYIPWGAANAEFTYLNSVLFSSPQYNLFQYYILNLTAPLYKELGFDAAADEKHATPYLRNIILDLNCCNGNPDCIATAQKMFESFRKNPSVRLNPDIQTLVYCTSLRGGSVENFNFLWGMFLASQDSSEKFILLNAMGCTSNAERRSFYMNQVISDSSPVRKQDRHTILVSVINAGSESTNAALYFVIENFAKIQPRVQGLTGTTDILNAFARRLTTGEQYDKIVELYNRYKGILTAGELASINGIRENIRASITWSNEKAQFVESWLTDHYGDTDNGAVVRT